MYLRMYIFIFFLLFLIYIYIYICIYIHIQYDLILFLWKNLCVGMSTRSFDELNLDVAVEYAKEEK